ncbi:ubiquitin-like-conjugating enzyme ATG10 [Galleria mellonella]|uniref:Ubiquitin-like-conjugating enzyme ATG10 n=1 Tax=Galleria mellonella TaxID=7137 RepID=A0A6J1X346_GALME|nr:ubiquitin-like-conjugating enzyme ATG10 [Galleria mellonella]
MDSNTTITPEEFTYFAKQFCEISNRLCDGWVFCKDKEIHRCYLKKDTFISHEGENENTLLRAEFVIFYNLSYGVPSFSFNIWNSAGVLLTLEDIRTMSFITIKREDFYSVITQQEHRLFLRPYFVMHPCHTATLLATLKNKSKNIIVTFLSLITPLLRLKLPFEYGL